MTKKIVLITGAAGGIGRALTKEFAKHQYKVIAVDKEEAKYEGENISFFKADLKSEQEIKKVFAYIKEKFGGADVLINNAAISKFHKHILEVRKEEFEEVIKVNLTGSFLCAKEFIQINQNQEYGRIINIASTRWNQNEANWEAYGASKGGIVSLTNSLCVSLSDTKITVNAISPGWIVTDPTENLSESDHKQHPTGRVGKVEDITRVALFLAEEASEFINGANIVVDGGMTKRMIYEV